MNKEHLELLDFACATQVRFLPSERECRREPTLRRARIKGVEFARETWRNTQGSTVPPLSPCRPIEIIPSGSRCAQNWSVHRRGVDQERPTGRVYRNVRGGGEGARSIRAIYTWPPHLDGINLHASRLNELGRVSCEPAGREGSLASARQGSASRTTRERESRSFARRVSSEGGVIQNCQGCCTSPLFHI